MRIARNLRWFSGGYAQSSEWRESADTQRVCVGGRELLAAPHAASKAVHRRKLYSPRLRFLFAALLNGLNHHRVPLTVGVDGLHQRLGEANLRSIFRLWLLRPGWRQQAIADCGTIGRPLGEPLVQFPR